ncbi:hypothetical protein RhiirA5_433668, partial [Rhizophagus irregularis]
FINWTSGSEKIDNFIKEKQLEINSPQSIILKWIPYDQFSDINEVNNDNLSIIYSAKWKNGPIYWDKNIKEYKNYQNNKNNEVTLKYLRNLQNFEEFINEAKIHSINLKLHGISQILNTKDYILVLIEDFMYGNYCIKCNKGYTDIIGKWCRKCQINNFRKDFVNWTSGNKKIDNFIQEKQLEIDSPQSIIFEWILYDQFSEINEIDNNDFSIVYSAKRKNEKQLEIDSPQSTILKWIPYDQFSEINEVDNNDSFTVYSAIWKNGPLDCDKHSKKYKRHQDNKNNEVALKYLHNLQNIEEFLNEVIHSTSTKFNIYGISSMPNIDDFIIVLQDKGYCIKCNEAYTNITCKWCKQCQTNNLRKNFINWTSENEKIDNFIKEKQLEINGPQSTILEWILYDQFSDINEKIQKASR